MCLGLLSLQGSHRPSTDTASIARAAFLPAPLILWPRAWALPCKPWAGPTCSRRLALVASVPVWHCGCVLPLLRGSRAGWMEFVCGAARVAATSCPGGHGAASGIGPLGLWALRKALCQAEQLLLRGV